MKLTYFQLEPHLAKTLAPVYIVSGDEILLKQDAINLIRKAAKLAGFERVKIADANQDWEQLYTILHSNNLFATKQLFEIDCRDNTPNKNISSILQEYAKNPGEHNVLLIDIGKVDDKIAKSAWYKSLEKVGVAIPLWPIPREQLPQWIMNRAKRYKMQIHQDAAVMLAGYIKGNLVAAAQVIEKLYLLKPQKSVDSALIQTILTDESRFTVFDFIDSLISRDKTRSLHILKNLEVEGTEPVLVLWAITRELRQMADLALQKKQGAVLETLFAKYRIFSRRQHSVKNFLAIYSAEDCWNFLNQSTKIDWMIKGVAPGNVWDALQLFCLNIVCK